MKKALLFFFISIFSIFAEGAKVKITEEEKKIIDNLSLYLYNNVELKDCEHSTYKTESIVLLNISENMIARYKIKNISDNRELNRRVYKFIVEEYGKEYSFAKGFENKTMKIIFKCENLTLLYR